MFSHDVLEQQGAGNAFLTARNFFTNVGEAFACAVCLRRVRRFFLCRLCRFFASLVPHFIVIGILPVNFRINWLLCACMSSAQAPTTSVSRS